MSQAEIDEISATFSEAWKENFGMDIYYLKQKPSPSSPTHPLYKEKLNKIEDYDVFGPIPATFKRNPTEEECTAAGLEAKVSGILTVVSKDIRDLGILEISAKDFIRIVDRDSVETIYLIKSVNDRVQFINNYIFVKIGVDELEN